MKQREVLEQIKEAEMVLVGLGEEFDGSHILGKEEAYCQGRGYLENSENCDFIPLWDRYSLQQQKNGEVLEKVENALQNLAKALENKNYFVISVSTNGILQAVLWKEGRLVMPCGSDEKKQCENGCDKGIGSVTDEERSQIMSKFQGALPELSVKKERWGDLGVCPECGKKLQFNNIYNKKYDEKGYLEDWQRYTKWLQGTLNHRLLILELGVGMQYPSVIRWAFEKVAFFNQKATFYRVNENLYQMTEELAGKGTAIPENVIDWLQNLC